MTGGAETGQFPLGGGVTVVKASDWGVIALQKPAGVLSHPNKAGETGRALLKAPYDLENECYVIGEGGRERKIWLLNRLDSATSGVILLATEAEAAERVRQLFARGAVRKTYFALVFGAMKPARQVWKDRLQVSKKGGQLRTATSGGLEAETEVFLRKAYPGRAPVSLLELHPRTGRTHQLRVQCAQRSLPIIGDETYGDFRLNREFARATGEKRLFLHAAEIQLSLTLQGRTVSFAARSPLPAEFSPSR